MDEMDAIRLRAQARRRRAEAEAGSEADPSGGYGSQIFSGLLEGATGTLGFPVDAMNNFVIGPAMKGINAVFGTDLQPSAEPLGGSAGLRKGLAITPQSDSTGEQMARRVAQSIGGAAVPMAGTAQSLGQAAMGLGAAAGGGVGGAVAQQVFPDSVGAEIAGELIGGLATGGAIAGLANRSARKAIEAKVPTVQQLEEQAGEKFKEAHRMGVKASRPQTQQLARDIRLVAESEGLISPTGRVSEAYPKAREALSLVDDYSLGEMSVPQMQTVRKVLADAAKSNDKAERRIATIMLERFDNFTSPLAPPLAQGRELYTRAMRGDQLETLRELAEANRSKYSASGVENALRNEYRNLNRRIIKGQERGWSPEMHDAIRKVDEGTRLSNTMRNVGKAAPTGPVSFMATVGTPGILGSAMGNPAVGATAAIASALAGYGARGAATSLGMRHAKIAELLARNGGQLPKPSNSANFQRILEALMGGQAAAQSMKGQ